MPEYEKKEKLQQPVGPSKVPHSRREPLAELRTPQSDPVWFLNMTLWKVNSDEIQKKHPGFALFRDVATKHVYLTCGELCLEVYPSQISSVIAQ